MTRASPVEGFAGEQGGGKVNELNWCGCGRVEELVCSEYSYKSCIVVTEGGTKVNSNACGTGVSKWSELCKVNSSSCGARLSNISGIGAGGRSRFEVCNRIFGVGWRAGVHKRDGDYRKFYACGSAGGRDVCEGTSSSNGCARVRASHFVCAELKEAKMTVCSSGQCKVLSICFCNENEVCDFLFGWARMLSCGDKTEGDQVKGEYKSSSHEGGAGKSDGRCRVCDWTVLRGTKDTTKAVVRTSSGMCASSKELLSSMESVTASCINEEYGECFIIRESVVNTDCTRIRQGGRGRRGRHRARNDQRHRLRGARLRRSAHCVKAQRCGEDRKHLGVSSQDCDHVTDFGVGSQDCDQEKNKTIWVSGKDCDQMIDYWGSSKGCNQEKKHCGWRQRLRNPERLCLQRWL